MVDASMLVLDVSETAVSFQDEGLGSVEQLHK